MSSTQLAGLTKFYGDLDTMAFRDGHGFDPAQDPEDEIEVGEEPGEYAFL